MREGSRGVQNNLLHGETVGHKMSATYRSWAAMRRRCLSSGASNYKWYGGRGITICKRWDVYIYFRSDMGECPTGMTLDRIDRDGNYEPSNCRWVSHTHQCRNRRSNRLLTLGSETRCIAEWAELTGIRPGLIRRRIVSGWSAERALSRKP